MICFVHGGTVHAGGTLYQTNIFWYPKINAAWLFAATAARICDRIFRRIHGGIRPGEFPDLELGGFTGLKCHAVRAAHRFTVDCGLAECGRTLCAKVKDRGASV